MRLILFELKKIFSSVFMWIALAVVVLLMANSVLASSNYKSDYGYKEFLEYLDKQDMSEDELIRYLKSEADSKINEIEELGDEYGNMPGKYTETFWGDFMLVLKASEDAEYYFREIPENRRTIVTNALMTVAGEKAKDVPDREVIIMNELAVSKYNRIINCKLADTGELTEVYSVFDNTLWEYMMIIFTIIFSVRMFSVDIPKGTYRIIYTSANGKKRLYFSKLIACFMIISACVLIQALCQIICGVVCFGVDDFALPLQMVQKYEFCPFNITIGGFYAVKTVGKLLFYVLCCSISALITILSRRILPSAGISAVLFIAPKILLEFLSSNGITKNALNVLRGIVPQSLLNSELYFLDFDYVCIFTIPISRLLCVMIITAVLIISAVVISIYKFGKEER